jgi:tol-pal system protein YbgF
VRLSLLFLPLVAAGCVRDSAARVQVTELQRQVEALRRQADRDRQTMRSVEDRVFVVEDKVDTQSVAAARDPSVVPKLPVVKKEPLPDAAEPITAAPVDNELPPLRYSDYDRGTSVSSTPPAPRRAPVEIRDPEERGYPRVEDPSSDRISVGTTPPKIPAPKQDSALAVYRAAYEALGRHEHPLAVAGFRTFLARWPAHEHADNAQYWLGEAAYDQGNWKQALAEFSRVVERYPTGNKAPDAMLKVGFCHAKLGDPAASREALEQVLSVYPKTDAARLAERRLAEGGEKP